MITRTGACPPHYPITSPSPCRHAAPTDLAEPLPLPRVEGTTPAHRREGPIDCRGRCHQALPASRLPLDRQLFDPQVTNGPTWAVGLRSRVGSDRAYDR